MLIFAGDFKKAFPGKGTTMDNDKKTLRRYEDDLTVGGFGVAILGAWDVLKVFIQMLMEAKETFAMDGIEDEGKIVAAISIIVVIALLLLISFIILKLHFYIGLNAAKAAKGQPYKKGYYTAAVILLVLSIIGMSSYIDDIRDLDSIDTTIASILVDLTSIYVLVTVITATGKVRALRAKPAQE